MTEKKALVILTNEAFLPKSGRGRFRSDDPLMQQWQNIHAPASPAGDSEWRQEFTKLHRLTGIDALEVGYIWLVLKRHLNMDITFASPRGGAVAIDPASCELAEKDEKLKNRLRNDREFMEHLSHTYPISWINPEEYECAILPGRHGAMFDLPECDSVERCIAQIYENNGWVCAIGHGVAGLLNVRCSTSTSSSAREYLIKGKRVACVPNSEEKEKRLDEFLPFLLEDKVKERGARVDTSKPFTPHVVDDERLITAQSYPSTKQFVQKIADKIRPQQKVDIERIAYP